MVVKYKTFSTLEHKSTHHEVKIDPKDKPYKAFEACKTVVPISTGSFFGGKEVKKCMANF